jgi:hypothetical protein
MSDNLLSWRRPRETTGNLFRDVFGKQRFAVTPVGAGGDDVGGT